MQLATVVSPEIVEMSPDATLIEAARAMHREELGSVAVMQDSQLVGIFTERDLLHAVAGGGDLEEGRIGEWMTAPADTVDVSMEIRDAAEWMLASGYRHLPVIEDEKVLGMVSIKDVMWGITADEL